MPQTARCSVCSSPRRADADAALNAGQSYERVAALVGVSKASVARHRQNGHVKPTLGARRQPVIPWIALRADATAYEHAARIVASLAAVDTSTLSPREASNHSEAYRRAVDTLGRLQPTQVAQESVSEAEEKIKTLEEFLAVHDAVIERLPAPLRAVFALAMHERFEGRKRGATPPSTLALAARGEDILVRLAAQERGS